MSAVLLPINPPKLCPGDFFLDKTEKFFHLFIRKRLERVIFLKNSLTVLEGLQVVGKIPWNPLDDI